jgi:hypothetical protein
MLSELVLRNIGSYASLRSNQIKWTQHNKEGAWNIHVSSSLETTVTFMCKWI